MRPTSAAPALAAVLALLAFATGSAGATASPAGAPAQVPTDQLIVRFAEQSLPDSASLAATAGEPLQQSRRLADGAYVLKLSGRRSPAQLAKIIERLAARGDVASAEPDALLLPLATPDDPRYGDQWHYFAPSSGFFGANLPGAWDLTTGSSSVVVGVIDTGYRPHADLAGRFVSGYDFIGDALVANDGGGRDADASDPGDWVSTTENATGYFAGCGVRNSSWHGTHVSGTIGAATNNAVGVAGINRVSKIQPLRVLGKCGGYTSDIADAIRWGAGLSVSGAPANATPSDVVNLSLGGGGSCSSTMQSAIDAAVAAGTTVVVAAGNSNSDASGFSPANCNNVITVAATGHTGARAYYSNYGATVEIAAPGGDAQLGRTVLSTLNAGTTTPGADSYAYYQGTSMAAPHVAGIASLLLSVNAALTPAQVGDLLRTTVTPFPAGSNCTTALCGTGIVNAAAAVAQAAGGAGPTPPGAFGKVAPASGATGQASSVSLSWSTSAGAGQYEYCIDAIVNASCDGSWIATTATSVVVSTPLAGTTYQWQVRASNAGGTTSSDAGTWWSFTTTAAGTAPAPFSKLSPSNGAQKLRAPVTLKWEASAGAAGYEWCVSTVSGTCTKWTPASGTSAVVTGLSRATNFYWQVRATGGGTTGANGDTWWAFRTR